MSRKHEDRNANKYDALHVDCQCSQILEFRARQPSDPHNAILTASQDLRAHARNTDARTHHQASRTEVPASHLEEASFIASGFLPSAVAFIDIENSVGLGESMSEEHEFLLRILFRRCCELAARTTFESTSVWLDGRPFSATRRPRVYWYTQFTGDGILVCAQPWIEDNNEPASVPVPEKARTPLRQHTFGWGPGETDYVEYSRRKRAIALAIELVQRFVRNTKLYWLRNPPNSKRLREGREPIALTAGIHVCWLYWIDEPIPDDARSAPPGTEIAVTRGRLVPESVGISYAARLQSAAKEPEFAFANIALSAQVRALSKRFRLHGFRWPTQVGARLKGIHHEQRVYGVSEIRPLPFLDDINPLHEQYRLGVSHRGSSQPGSVALHAPQHVLEAVTSTAANWNNDEYSPRNNILRKIHDRAQLQGWAGVELIHSLVYDLDDEQDASEDDFKVARGEDQACDSPWGVNRIVRLRRLSSAYNLARNIELARNSDEGIRPVSISTLLAEISALSAIYNGWLSERSAPEPYVAVGATSVANHLERARRYLTDARLASGGKTSRFEETCLVDATIRVVVVEQAMEARSVPGLAPNGIDPVQDQLNWLRKYARRERFRAAVMSAVVAKHKRAESVPGKVLEEQLDALDFSSWAEVEAEFRRALEASHSCVARCELWWLFLMCHLVLGARPEALEWIRKRVKEEARRAEAVSRSCVVVDPTMFGLKLVVSGPWRTERVVRQIAGIELVHPRFMSELADAVRSPARKSGGTQLR